MFKKFDTDLYEKLEQLKEQSAPPEEDEPEEENDPELEKRIERLDKLFDRMNNFFASAENTVDLIGDGILSLLKSNDDDDDDDDEQPAYERFAMSENGYDPAMTDEFFDELEHKILYKLDPAYKELFTNGIEAKPYDFKAEDEIFKVLPKIENGYNKSAVKEYYKNIKTMAAERWNGE